MKAKQSRLLVPFVTVAFASSVLFTTPVQAELIATKQVASPEVSERDRVKAALERPELAQKLQTLGVLPADALSRVDALTDAEISVLANAVDVLPAGGLTNTEWFLIALGIILILVVAL
jgi:hypothetical protein